VFSNPHAVAPLGRPTNLDTLNITRKLFIFVTSANAGPSRSKTRTPGKQFEVEYSKTAPLYYRGQIPLDKILARIQRDLARL
jgi:hypothetical protein